ncbi:hypothetical protein GCM10028816_51570 [Spirosoma lituiforme]
MGLYNGYDIFRFEHCPMTASSVSYDVPSSGFDGLEYTLPSINPNAIIRITGSVLGDDAFTVLRNHSSHLIDMISACQDTYFYVDTYLVKSFS